MTKRFVSKRHEIKYLVSTTEADVFCERISDLLIADPQNDGQGYLNYSIYFDSPQFTFYNEQKRGLTTRSKPRLRTYRANFNAPPLAIFLEFKYREQNLVAKERTALNSAQAYCILNGDKVEGLNYNTGDSVIEKFAALAERIELRTSVGVIYHRMAFSCSIQNDLRITLDTQIQFTNRRELTPSENAFRSSEPLNRAIIELKYLSKVPKQIEKAAEFMEFQKASYSKYTNAIEQIFGTPRPPMP